MHHACIHVKTLLFILEINVANLPGKVVRGGELRGEITGHQGPVRVVRLKGLTYICMHVLVRLL